MKNKKTAGISLVALVITIIVLIILTGAVIVTFMEGGIIDRTKEATFKSDIRTYQEILAIKRAEDQIAIATGKKESSELNGKSAEEIQIIIPEFKDEYEGIVQVLNGELVAIDEPTEETKEGKWLIDLGISTAEEVKEKQVVHNGIIPESGVYYVGVTSIYIGEYGTATHTYIEKNEFPEIVNTGDIYVYGDYEYRYNMKYNIHNWEIDEGLNGWGVAVLDVTNEKYDTILTSINSKNIVSMSWTFNNCILLVNAPVIPNNVTNMEGTFAECKALVTAPVIPDGVNDMDYTFVNCALLIDAPAIPSSVKYMHDTFGSCKSLVTAPVIPDGVEKMSWTFIECTSLVTAPVIPSSVINIDAIFNGCTNLTGVIEIDANPESYEVALMGTTKPITLTGSSTLLNEIAATATNGNVTVAQ